MLRTVNAVVKLSVRCCSLRLACPKGPKLYFKLSLRAERGKQASKPPLNSPNRGPQRTTHNSGPGRSVKFNFPELPSPPLRTDVSAIIIQGSRSSVVYEPCLVPKKKFDNPPSMQRRSFQKSYFRQHQHLRLPRRLLFWARTEFSPATEGLSPSFSLPPPILGRALEGL